MSTTVCMCRSEAHMWLSPSTMEGSEPERGHSGLAVSAFTQDSSGLDLLLLTDHIQL